MLEIKLSKENFEKEIKDGVVLVDFFATWCGPCKMISPIISEIAEEFKGIIKVGKVNTDEENDLAIKYQIVNIPTLILFKNGNPINTIVGLHSKDEIAEMIKKVYRN